jgi:hypothetical protein
MATRSNNFKTISGSRHDLEVGESAPRAHRSCGAPLSPWQKERANRLHRICAAIERKRHEGQTLHEALLYPVRTWNGQDLNTGKPFRLSRGTLTRLFYHWQKSGRCAECFRLGYRAKKRTLSARNLRDFIRGASAPGVTGIGAPRRRLACKLECSPRTVDRLLPRPVKAQLRRLHRARLAATQAERHFKTFCATQK